MTTNNIRGNVAVAIKSQEARSRWEQKLMQRALDAGMGAEQELRFQCRIAQDSNAAFDRIEDASGNTWVLNPKSHAQFGKNAKGLPYLTLGLINEATDERLSLTWEGDAVPSKMKEVAVKHDEGKRCAAARVRLRLEDAKQTVTRDQRTAPRRAAAARRRDKIKSGQHTPKPRNHGRICRDDLS